MKRALIVLALLTLALLPLACEEEKPPEPTPPVTPPPPAGPEITLKTIEPVNVLVMACTGDYKQMGPNIDTAMKALEEAKITLAGPMMTIYFDDPALIPPEELRYELLFPVAEGTKAPKGFTTRVEPGGETAWMEFKGEFTDTHMPDYAALFKWIGEQKREMMGSMTEVYRVWNPEKPAENVTEVYVMLKPVEPAAAPAATPVPPAAMPAPPAK